MQEQMRSATQIVEKSISNLGEKFRLLWPSTNNTPPTEDNLVTALVESFHDADYLTYTEVPTKGNRPGRVDLLAVDRSTKSQLFIAELKSDSPTYKPQMIEDWKRMNEFSVDNLYYWFGNTHIHSLYLLQAIWSETPATLQYFQRIVRVSEPIDPKIDQFGAIVQSSALKDLKRLHIDDKQTLSVLYFGGPGVLHAVSG